MRATVETIDAEMNALSQTQLSWRPAPDAWCINEIVGHLIEAERRGFAGRIRTILEHDLPRLETWDQPAVARDRRDCERAGRELVREFKRMRLESLKLVESLTFDQLGRMGSHPDVGELKIIDLIHEWVFHDRSHMQQIFDNIKAMMWMHMGNSRRFSQPEG